MNELYMGQFKEDRWKDIELEGVDMDNLRKDINKENLPLEYQARRYGLSGYQYFWNTSPPREDKPSPMQMKDIKFPEDYFMYARTFIYPQIFGAKYR